MCTEDTTAVAFPTKPIRYRYLRRFILMTYCRTETGTVRRTRKLDHSTVITAVAAKN